MEEDKEVSYDKEMAEIFVDPFLYAIKMHIENIQKEENGPDIKKEYIEGLETILVQQDISTAVSVFPQLSQCVDLMFVPEIGSEICVLLAHISQNVAPVAKEFIRCKVFSKALSLYEKDSRTGNKIVFLFTVLNNTLPNLSSELSACNENPSDIKKMSLSDASLSEASKERLAVLHRSLEQKK